jgi:hypothetical protein
VNELRLLLAKVKTFEKEAHAILAVHEASGSRVIVLEESYEKLTKLSLKQDELFRQALRCVEHKLFRAAHVLAWAGFMDLLEEKLASDGLTKVRLVRPAWKAKSIEDIRETYAEFQIIEVARDLDLCTKTQMKALHGMLNKRNECAHPSDFYPDVNDTLGYISELLSRIAILQPKTL